MSLCIDKFTKELMDVENSISAFTFSREEHVAFLVVNYIQQFCPNKEDLDKLVITINCPNNRYANKLKILSTEDKSDYLFKVEYIDNKHEFIYSVNRRLNEYGLVMISPDISDDIIDTKYEYYRIVTTDLWNGKYKHMN